MNQTVVRKEEFVPNLLLSKRTKQLRHLTSIIGQSLLFLIALTSASSVLFIFIFIFKDALPFFKLQGFSEFFTSIKWYPSGSPAEFGALAIFVGSGLVTLGAVLIAVPMGVTAAVCLSEVLSFTFRQYLKPVIEILAAIPSVAYGFFALVVLAPWFQEYDGQILSVAVWLIGTPLMVLIIFILGDIASRKIPLPSASTSRLLAIILLGVLAFWGLHLIAAQLSKIQISSGTNALNVSIILGIMALPTIVSVSEDALQAVSREMREGAYALGATRAETVLKVVLPVAASGILAAVILGIMRAVGETMVVWMASGNAAQIPKPWFNFLEPVRTLTATIAGDMGEADQVTGSARYHVLFAMAACLLAFSFICNIVSEWIIRKARRKLRGE